MNNTYIYNHRVSVHEIDAFGLWRPDSILRLMQYVAGLHSQALGYSRDKLIKEHKTVWMLSSIAVKFLRYPGFDEELSLATWYGQPERVLLPRYAEITDKHGLIAALATSWVIVDIDSRRILPAERADLVFPSASKRIPTLKLDGRLRLKKTGLVESSKRTPRYCDIDINGHMNLSLIHISEPTRLLSISYAVFCLKKKTKKKKKQTYTIYCNRETKNKQKRRVII